MLNLRSKVGPACERQGNNQDDKGMACCRFYRSLRGRFCRVLFCFLAPFVPVYPGCCPILSRFLPILPHFVRSGKFSSFMFEWASKLYHL